MGGLCVGVRAYVRACLCVCLCVCGYTQREIWNLIKEEPFIYPLNDGPIGSERKGVSESPHLDLCIKQANLSQ
ncbi:unnamed protein product [Arctogadus glacialis]